MSRLNKHGKVRNGGKKWRNIPHASKARGFSRRSAPKDDLSVHAVGAGRMYKAFDGVNEESKRLRRLEAQEKSDSKLLAVIYKEIDIVDSESPARFAFQYKLLKRAMQTKVFGAHDFVVPFVHLNPDRCIAFGLVIKFEGMIFCGQVFGDEKYFAPTTVTREVVTRAALLGSAHYPGHDFKLCAEATRILYHNCMAATINTDTFKCLKTFAQALLLRTDTLDATAIVRGLFEHDYTKGGTNVVNHLVLKDKVELMKILLAPFADKEYPLKFYPRDFVQSDKVSKLDELDAPDISKGITFS